MSNIAPQPLKTVVVLDDLLDFVEPIYTISGPSSLKSFNSQDITTYSNSFINATLQLNSSDFIVDPAILHVQPVTFTITGSSTLTNPLLLDGCFSLRSNALYKAVQTCDIKLGSTSNTVNISDTISACERYNNFTTEKFLNSYGLSYLDQSQDYADLVGAPRNPMALYSTGVDMIEHRGAYPITIISNTASSAQFSTVLRQLVPISPLVDKIRRDGSSVQGISHLNNISFNITFCTNAGNRMLSFAKNRTNNDILTLTNIAVTIGQPTFSFVQLKSRNESIPRVLSYPLISQERYVYTIGSTLAQGSTVTFNVSSFNLSRVPHSMLLYARPSNAELLNTINGVYIPDTFAKLSKLTLLYDGQTLFGQSIPENYYSMSVHNGLQDTWTQYSGLPIVKSATNSTYMYGVGSVMKLEFGKDISLYPNITVGGYNECAISLQVDITNLSPLSTHLELYMVMLYSDVIQLYDNNLAQISNIPVSQADIMNSKSSETVHRVSLKNADITGSGLLSSVGNFLKSPKLLSVIKTMKTAFNSGPGRSARAMIKDNLTRRGHPNFSKNLHSIGFGKPRRRGGAMSGGDDYEGGAMADNHDLAESLYN